MFDHNGPKFKKSVEEAVERLTYILSRISDNLINVFHLDREESGSDIELPILLAFLKGKQKIY